MSPAIYDVFLIGILGLVFRGYTQCRVMDQRARRWHLWGEGEFFWREFHGPFGFIILDFNVDVDFVVNMMIIWGDTVDIIHMLCLVHFQKEDNEMCMCSLPPTIAWTLQVSQDNYKYWNNKQIHRGYEN